MTQMSNLIKYKNSYKSIDITNSKMKFVVVVAENYCQHTFRALTDCKRSVFKNIAFTYGSHMCL